MSRVNSRDSRWTFLLRWLLVLKKEEPSIRSETPRIREARTTNPTIWSQKSTTTRTTYCMKTYVTKAILLSLSPSSSPSLFLRRRSDTITTNQLGQGVVYKHYTLRQTSIVRCRSVRHGRQLSDPAISMRIRYVTIPSSPPVLTHSSIPGPSRRSTGLSFDATRFR